MIIGAGFPLFLYSNFSRKRAETGMTSMCDWVTSEVIRRRGVETAPPQKALDLPAAPVGKADASNSMGVPERLKIIRGLRRPVRWVRTEENRYKVVKSFMTGRKCDHRVLVKSAPLRIAGCSRHSFQNLDERDWPSQL